MEKVKELSHLFIDTSAFVALADRSDSFHERALSFSNGLSPSVRLVTSHFIFDETMTRIRSTLGVAIATRWGEELLSNPGYKMIWVDKRICQKALEKMKKYADHLLSFTDCTTIVILEKLRRKDVFSFDHDFIKVGLQTHPSN